MANQTARTYTPLPTPEEIVALAAKHGLKLLPDQMLRRDDDGKPYAACALGVLLADLRGLENVSSVVYDAELPYDSAAASGMIQGFDTASTAPCSCSGCFRMRDTQPYRDGLQIGATTRPLALASS